MYLTRRGWITYTLLTLTAFGGACASVLAAGTDAALWFLSGALWSWTLSKWAAAHQERRRGWKIHAHEHPDGGITAMLLLADPDHHNQKGRR